MRDASVLPVGPDTAVVLADDGLGDREAKAIALAFGAGFVQTVEALEDVLQVGPGKLVAGIGYRQQGMVAAVAQLHTDNGRGRTVFGGIVQQIQEHLTQTLGITGNLRNIVIVIQIIQLDL